ncbi:hypothetical protein G6F56_013039 [Rhizopus delemar]|nr:hypothetical protein G6F56_013039 [Rhizopus delemar]
MEGVPALREILEKGDYLCKIDLKDAYVVVPIHQESQKYLTFEQEGLVYQYTSLAFGLSVAPRIFSKRMRYAVESLRAKDDLSTFRRPWIPDQQGKECVRTEEVTRIPRIPVQYKNNEDIIASSKDQQIATTFTPSRESNNPILQMDCQFTREDDSSNTSNWRSFMAYSAPAERSGKELTPEPSKLGSELSDITMGEIGNQVVERISGEEE